MIVNFIIVLLVLCGLLVNYHKTVLIYGAVSIFVQPYMCLVYSPALTCDFAASMMIIGMYFLKGKNRTNAKPFILRREFILIALLCLISGFVSSNGFIANFPNIIVSITQLLAVVVFFKELNSLNDIDITVKWLLLGFTIWAVYGVIEFAIQSNPFYDYYADSIAPELLKGKLFPSDLRMGGWRTQTVMSICISWGGACAIMAGFMFLMRDYLYKTKPMLFWFIAGLVLFGVVSSVSKSAILAVVAMLLPYIFVKGEKKFKIVFTIAAIAFVFLFKDSLMALVNSAIGVEDSNVDFGSSSNAAMRVDQLNAVLNVLQEHPLFGLGAKGYDVAFSSNHEILGAESIWLQTLINYGFVGVVIWTMLYIKLAKISVRSYTNKFCALMFVVGWVLFRTASSSPGLEEVDFIYFIIVLYKYNQLKTSRASNVASYDLPERGGTILTNNKQLAV